MVVAPRVFYLGGFSVSVEGVRFFSFSLANEEEIRILVVLLLSGINVCKRAGRETRKLLGGSPGFLPGGLFRFSGRSQIFLFFSCKSRGDQYLRGTSIMSSVLVVRLAMLLGSSPGFLPGGLFRIGGRDQIFLFFSCKSGEDPYLGVVFIC